MKWLIAVVVCVAGYATANEDYETEIVDVKGIERMNEQNYRAIVTKGDVLVYFHHDKCTDCIKISPFLGNISEVLSKKRPGLTVAEVDVDHSPSLAGLFKVEFFPTWTLIMNKGAKELHFTGKPSFKDLFIWTVRQVGDKFETIKKIEGLKEVRNSSTMVLYIQGDYQKDQIQKIGEYFYPKYGNLTIAYSSSKLLEGVDIRLFKTFDFIEEPYDGSLSIEQLEPFIANQSQYIVMPTDSTDYSSKMFTKIGTTNIFLFTHDLDCEEYREFVKAAVDLHKTTNKIHNWGHVKIDTGKFTNLYSYLSHNKIEGSELWIVIKQEEGVFKYKWHEKIDYHGIKEFIAKFENGHLMQKVKSQPIPESQPEEGITFVVGDTFEDEVLNSPENVLLLIISTNCKYSHEMVPHYDEIAKMMLPFKDHLKFTVMDGLHNEINDLYIGGFPTLLLFKAGAKDEEPEEFADTRHKPAILRFIVESLPEIDFSSVVKEEDIKVEEVEEEPIDLSKWMTDTDL